MRSLHAFWHVVSYVENEEVVDGNELCNGLLVTMRLAEKQMPQLCHLSVRALQYHTQHAWNK